MKVIAVWNPKGGVGKTLLSLNLAAAAFYELGLKPLIIDSDQHGLANEYFRAGNLPFTVQMDDSRPSDDIDLVIEDTEAADWDHLPDCRTVIVPVVPERSSYSISARAIALLKKTNKRIILVVTNGDPHLPLEQENVLTLKKRGAFEIRHSGAFSKAAEEYRTIFDPVLNRFNKIKDRRKEFSAILAAALSAEETTELQTHSQKVAVNG